MPASLPLVIRDAEPEDVPAILGLVRELAEFEREPDAVKATEADYLRDGFGPDRRFFCRVATRGGAVVGFALWFRNYSTWLGRSGMYLEDLYVTQSERGTGAGAAIVRDLARVAVADGAQRLDLSVLHWNPARGFYEKLGLKHMQDWLPYRIAGDDLKRLANEL